MVQLIATKQISNQVIGTVLSGELFKARPRYADFLVKAGLAKYTKTKQQQKPKSKKHNKKAR